MKTKTINLQPVNKYLLIEREQAETKSAGGILLPGAEKKKMNQGVVVGVGPLCAQKWNLGDRIVFQEYGTFEVSGEDKLVLVQEDLVYVKLL